MLRRPIFRFASRLLKWTLLCGTVFSLLETFYPHSNPDGLNSLPLPQQRRIQEADRALQPKKRISASERLNNVSELSTPRSYGRRTYKDKTVFVSNYSLPFLEVPQQDARKDAQRLVLWECIKDDEYVGGSRGWRGRAVAFLLGLIFASGRVNSALSTRLIFVISCCQNRLPKDQNLMLTLLSMKEHGVKLAEEQESLIAATDTKKPQTRSIFSNVRKRNEQLYFAQLRKKGQIQPLPSGGERIIATPSEPVRFPASLQAVPPEEWTGDFRLFLNLTFYPWPRTDSCDQFFTRFAPPRSLKTSALASFPSSGNSWLRYLIESSSGISTGSMYDDSSLTRKGMYGEQVIFDSGMTILQKTHGYTTGPDMHLLHSERIKSNHMEELSNQGVIVIRNPFKALVSHRHLDAGGHTGYAPMSHFKGEDWRKFVLLKTKLWKEFYIDWLVATRPQDLHVVFYEDIKFRPLDVLRTILKFLHLPIDSKRLACLSMHSDGSFKRRLSKVHPPKMNLFTREMQECIYAAIDELSEVLKMRAKDPLPVYLYDLYNASEADSFRQHRNSMKTQICGAV